MPDLHSETWWIRALDGELSPEEQGMWEQHLMFCESCRQEWHDLQEMEMFMRMVPLPLAPVSLAAATLNQLTEKDQQQRRIALIGGSIGLFSLIFAATFALLPTLLTIDQFAAVVTGSWDVLLRTLIRVLFDALATWKILVPALAGVSGLAMLLAAPNGLVVTLAVLWARRRPQRPTV
jgi:anti-sigma factor RsiW